MPLPRPTERPTVKEVADRAQVALSSVSRVLNNNPNVSQELRDRVMRAIQELGYEPNLVAASLRSGSTNTIGFLVSDIANPLFADIASGAAQRLEKDGYSVVLTNSQGDAEREERMARLLRRRRVDGLIISLADDQRPSTMAELAQNETPLVLLDRSNKSLPASSVVKADHATGMKEAVELLAGLGHRHIGLITGSLAIEPGRERLRGYQLGHETSGITPDQDLVVSGATTPGLGEEAAARLLKSAEQMPTALICGSNLILIGALRVCRREGLEIGTDLSLVACDDVPVAELNSPPITVIDRDTALMGEIAAELLLDRLQHDSSPRQVTLPTRLVVRASTSPSS